jgi:hypothetical protein
MPQGGVPAPGTYYLTGWNRYTGPGGAAGRSSLAIGETVDLTVSGGNVVTMQIVVNDGPFTEDVHQTLQLTIAGTKGQGSYTCPFTGSGPFGITSDATSFHFLFVDPDGQEEHIFTKQ